MKEHLLLLKTEPLFRRLSLIQLIAYFAAWFSNVAIYTLLIEMSVDPIVIALTAALHFLPGVLQAPFSGPLIDRYRPKTLMVLLVITQILATLSLMSIEDPTQLWLMFILVFIRMGASSFYFTLEMSLLPRLLDVTRLKMANEIHSVIWSFSYTVGMAVSGLVVYLIGVKMAFLLDALLFIVALYLLSGLRLSLEKKKEVEGYWTMMRNTLGYLKDAPLVRHLIILHAFVGFTAFDALVALMVERYYAPAVATALAIGLLHATRASGLVIGPILLGRWLDNHRLAYLFLFQGAAILMWALFLEDFVASLVISFFVGSVTTMLWSYTYTLLQHHTDERYYGRVVAYNDMAFLLTVAGVSLLIGLLAEWGSSLSTITALMGSMFFVGMGYYLWIKRGHDLKEIK